MQRLIVIFCFFLVQFDARSQDSLANSIQSTILDSSKAKRLLDQCSRATPQNISGYWNPSENDKVELERNFSKLEHKQNNFKLKNYAYQYIGVIIKEEKFIYINAFSKQVFENYDKSETKWESEPIVFCDGGSAFWGVLFNIKKLDFSEQVFGKSKGAQ